ncbi:HAD-IIIA family hydrolase [bacterium]|nr:HAD-IIIA family hydrolase [bacterium]
MELNLSQYRLAIFDIDGTLTEIRPEVLERQPRLVTPNHLGEQQPIPGVAEKLAELKAAGLEIALATNRGGVAFGYTTLEEAQALVEEAAEMCGIPEVKKYLCPYHAKARGPRSVAAFAREDDCRKPNPGMLLAALKDHGVEPADAFYVGDMDTDREAAQNAGVDFYAAEVFFRREERM